MYIQHVETWFWFRQQLHNASGTTFFINKWKFMTYGEMGGDWNHFSSLYQKEDKRRTNIFMALRLFFLELHCNFVNGNDSQSISFAKRKYFDYYKTIRIQLDTDIAPDGFGDLVSPTDENIRLYVMIMRLTIIGDWIAQSRPVGPGTPVQLFQVVLLNRKTNEKKG